MLIPKLNVVSKNNTFFYLSLINLFVKISAVLYLKN